MRATPRLTAMRFARAVVATWLLLAGAHAAPTEPVLTHFPQPGLATDQLGVIVNDDDPDSVAIATYYREKRGIPAANVIHVRFKPGRSTLSREEFINLKRLVDRKTPKNVQAYALTWAQPYRVDCMSITSAFAFGFDPAYCANSCKPTQPNPYFNSSVTRPYAVYHIRPTMSLAGASVAEARKLIDRGVASDGSNPAGTAYLVSTNDKNRNVRAAGYASVRALMQSVMPTEIVEANALENKPDVMFYFTGLNQVPAIDSNRFLPGAIADHLTSAGGELFGGGQMSSLRWLEAGATGSYGAVVEPCNFPTKFPVPGIVMAHYLQGETLIEAYWKSVQMPGQGIFIGEPLARPFAGIRHDTRGGGLTLSARLLTPGLYEVQAAPSMIGPYRSVGRMAIAWGTRRIRLEHVPPAYYRFERRADSAPVQ
ncbi:TIGR03790 family protein [Thiobacillus sp.]|uniref:TIGR03790 family protein n=1 Tax=Thiobacillus sp. TaxID=924 RepID=UPI0018377648|nr:TIGR03790 family protein [Thiobacillus sp.]MBC2731736.1 TIGR03790 family protein [Thiobacillus sp.]MBC2740474.1 TIGR03790 family protein [Thiobacillus sp.]MBC2758669.1 TIGR03790 family protein [Thiobacillus sp.]